MQRIKIISLYILLILFSFVSLGCDKTTLSIPSNTYVIEIDEYGKDLNKWVPKPGSVDIDMYTDTLSFVDSETGKRIKIVASYKIVYIK